MKSLLLIVIVVLCMFFIIPPFLKLCDGLGIIIVDMVEDIKTAFTETAKQWKELFLRFK